MNIFGVGPLEIFFIVLIALIVLGPKDMVKAGRTIGKFLRKIVTSENWSTIQQASQEIRTLPNRLIREAGIDEIQEGLKKDLTLEGSMHERKNPLPSHATDQDLADWTSPPNTIAPPDMSTNADDDEPLNSDTAGNDAHPTESSENNTASPKSLEISENN